MIVEEGARGSALLEQEPRMLDGFILTSVTYSVYRFTCPLASMLHILVRAKYDFFLCRTDFTYNSQFALSRVFFLRIKYV